MIRDGPPLSIETHIPGSEPLLGALDGGELPAQVVDKAFVELVLVELGREARRGVDVVIRLSSVGVA